MPPLVLLLLAAPVEGEHGAAGEVRVELDEVDRRLDVGIDGVRVVPRGIEGAGGGVGHQDSVRVLVEVHGIGGVVAVGLARVGVREVHRAEVRVGADRELLDPLVDLAGAGVRVAVVGAAGAVGVVQLLRAAATTRPEAAGAPGSRGPDLEPELVRLPGRSTRVGVGVVGQVSIGSKGSPVAARCWGSDAGSGSGAACSRAGSISAKQVQVGLRPAVVLRVREPGVFVAVGALDVRVPNAGVGYSRSVGRRAVRRRS
jgi:hypothetical protein